MKKYLLSFCLLAGLLAAPACTKKEDTDPACGTYNGHQLYRGPQNGCYYINSSGNKEYVARNLCTC